MQALRRAGRWIRARPPAVVLGFGWVVMLVYAFPGLMTQDSFDHLREARNGMYADSHPPAVNLLWKIGDYIFAGAFGLLVLQNLIFLGGLYALFRRTFAPRRAAWVALAVYLFPPVFLPMAVTWKDCLMAAFLVMGTVGLLSDRRTTRLWALGWLVAATAVRYNALGATLPLVVLLFEWRPGLGWVRRYALATAAWLAVTFAAFGVNEALTDRHMHYWHSSLALYDIVGTLAHVDEDLPDPELRELLAGTDCLVSTHLHAHARRLFTTSSFYPIIADEQQPLWRMPINGYDPAPEAQREAISRAWKDTLSRYPGAYARYRLHVTLDLLATDPGPSVVTTRSYPTPPYAVELGLSLGWSKLQRLMSRWLRKLAGALPLFVPSVYFFASLALLAFARRQRDVLALLLSGLAMEGTLVFLAHSTDYRYSHWMVLTTVLGAILLGVRRYRATTAARRTGAPLRADPPG